MAYGEIDMLQAGYEPIAWDLQVGELQLELFAIPKQHNVLGNQSQDNHRDETLSRLFVLKVFLNF